MSDGAEQGLGLVVPVAERIRVLTMLADHDSRGDPLTGLANRRAFHEALELEVERSRRFGDPLGLVMVDLDDFKRINDCYGHPQGDEVLREVGRVLRESCREIDLAVRYGGDEFVVLLAGTDLDAANELAERTRAGIAALEVAVLDGGHLLRVTASVGAASLPENASDGGTLTAAADAALREGRRNDGPGGGARVPRRPEPDRGAGGAALARPDPPHEADDPKPPHFR